MKILLLLSLLFSLVCNAYSMDKSPVLAKKHKLVKVLPCERDYGLDFCDKTHIKVIKNLISKKAPDFYKKFILVFINELEVRKSIVAFDNNTGIAYPLPFDYYGGFVDEKGFDVDKPGVGYNLNEDKICISGTTYAYRDVVENTISCFKFNGSGFERVFQ